MVAVSGGFSAALSLLSLIQQYGNHLNLAGGGAPECGRPGAVVQSRIIGGHGVRHGRYPWLVSVQVQRHHFCGGSLISSRVVLTAAHCIQAVRDKRQLSVVSGEHRIKSNDGSEKRHKVLVAVKHPGYKHPFLHDDVAVLQLASRVVWDQWRQPICLPSPDLSVEQGRRVTVAGWGWLGESGSENGRPANQLQQVQVSVLDSNTCQLWYMLADQKLKLKTGQMCAGEKAGGRDGCGGDSGGPMVLAEPLTSGINEGQYRFIQLGVVSGGIGCGRAHLPGVYTDLREYIVWLNTQVNKLDPKSHHANRR